MLERDGARPTPEESVQVSWQRSGDTVIATVAGEIDMDNAAHLGRELSAALDAADRRLIIDLAGVGFLGSAGIRVLAQHYDTASAAGTVIELRQLRPMIRRVLEISGMLDYFEIGQAAEG